MIARKHIINNLNIIDSSRSEINDSQDIFREKYNTQKTEQKQSQ